MAKKEISAAKPADTVIYKALVDLVIACIGVFLLQCVERSYTLPGKYDFWQAVFSWVGIAAAVVAVLGGAFTMVKKPGAKKIGIAVAATGLVVALACWALHKFWFVAMPYLYFILIAGCGLYLVSLLYPLDFTLISVLATLCGGTFYLHGQSSGTGASDVVLYVILVLLAAAIVLAAHKAAENKGILNIGKKSIRLLSGKAGPMPLYLTGAIAVACIIAALVLGVDFAFYCVYAAVGGLFVAACYYTVRLN